MIYAVGSPAEFLGGAVVNYTLTLEPQRTQATLAKRAEGQAPQEAKRTNKRSQAEARTRRQPAPTYLYPAVGVL